MTSLIGSSLAARDVKCGDMAVLVERTINMQTIRGAAVFALMIGLPAMCAAQARQAPATTNQSTTSIITQDPESHWLASGFVGSNFGRNAEPSSGEFGGSIGYLWKSKFGAEFDTGFTPSFQLQSNFFGLGIEPQINTYMANAIAALPLGAEGAWQPYVSGGGGAISLMSGNEGEAANFLSPNGTKFGGNVGGGLMGFAGSWGFKADVRYYRAAGAYQTSVSGVTPSPSPSTPTPGTPTPSPSTPTPGTPSPSPTPTPAPSPYGGPFGTTQVDSGTAQVAPPPGVTSKELVDTALSGLAFWRANVGVAFRW
jgi:hypothetical protein